MYKRAGNTKSFTSLDTFDNIEVSGAHRHPQQPDKILIGAITRCSVVAIRVMGAIKASAKISPIAQSRDLMILEIRRTTFIIILCHSKLQLIYKGIAYKSSHGSSRLSLPSA